MYRGDPNGGGAGRKSLIAASSRIRCGASRPATSTSWITSGTSSRLSKRRCGPWTIWWRRRVRYRLLRHARVESGAGADRYVEDWTLPYIALQLEYSLLERTIEGELIPAALELGLGVTPWSPLKGGMLTGKYTRESVKTVTPGRGAWVSRAFNEQAFKVLDVLTTIANEAGTTGKRERHWRGWYSGPESRRRSSRRHHPSGLEDNTGRARSQTDHPADRSR